MSAAELHFDFDVKIDKLATLAKEDFTIAEKDWLLNEAQNALVKRYYQGTTATGNGFETIQKRHDDLSSLVIKFPEQPALIPSILDTGVYELALNDLTFQYWFFIRGNVDVILPNECIKVATLKLIQHDDLNHALKDPFNNSDTSEVLFNFGRASDIQTSDFSRSSIYMYPGTYNLGAVRIEYLKKPAKISYGGYVYIDGVTYTAQTSELPDHVHSELVDVAVQLAAGIIESPEYMQMKALKVFSNE